MIDPQDGLGPSRPKAPTSSAELVLVLGKRLKAYKTYTTIVSASTESAASGVSGRRGVVSSPTLYSCALRNARITDRACSGFCNSCHKNVILSLDMNA